MYDFGMALTKMKEGKRVQRHSWHFNAYLYLMPGYEKVDTNSLTAERAEIPEGFAVSVEPYFQLYNKTENKIYMWTPRTVDILAEDWIEI